MTEPTSGVLCAWPEGSRFGRKIPKSKIYENIRVPNKVKQRFVSDVERIVWAYKLSPETIGLPATETVGEVQVLAVRAKGEDVADDVLVTIDRAIPSELIFEVEGTTGDGARVRTVAVQAHRTASRTDRTVYTSAWMPTTTERTPLPQAIDLEGLYAGLLAPLLPVKTAPGESLEAAAERAHKADRLQREIDQLTRKLARERQFNRKVDLRREIETARGQLERLKDSPMGVLATSEG